MNEQKLAGRSGCRGRQARETSAPAREVNSRKLRNPFSPMKLYSDEAIHEAAPRRKADLEPANRLKKNGPAEPTRSQGR